jgi:hypothetical protein
MSPFTRDPRTLARPPCPSWTLPPITDFRRMTTFRAFSACTFPVTRIPLATSLAARWTVMAP